MNYLLAALVGLAWGALGAFINSRITKAAISKNTNNAIIGMNVAHFIVDIAALATVFFLRGVLPFSFEVTLIATAAGLSIVNIIFSFSMSHKD